MEKGTEGAGSHGFRDGKVDEGVPPKTQLLTQRETGRGGGAVGRGRKSGLQLLSEDGARAQPGLLRRRLGKPKLI